tara:strand:- start:92 stop:403 length:312 start_codon:yes stop_codon:yes gene_type:complete
MEKKMIHNKEARVLLESFFHFSYEVYSMDKMIDELENIQDSLPYKDEYGNFNEDYTEINKVIIQLRKSSETIHEVMGLTFNKEVKDIMDKYKCPTQWSIINGT